MDCRLSQAEERRSPHENLFRIRTERHSCVMGRVPPKRQARTRTCRRPLWESWGRPVTTPAKHIRGHNCGGSDQGHPPAAKV